MAQQHDVIVIGAGIIGCAIARELARRGASVRIFDARAIGAGATQASAGVLAPYIEAHDRGPLFTLTIRSLAMYHRFVEEAAGESGIGVEYRRCGTLEIATDNSSAERMKQAAAAEAEPGLMDWLDAAAARGAEPSLAGAIEGALLIRQHAYVAVPALMDALAWSAVRHGAELEAGRRVDSVRRDGSGLAVLTEDGVVWHADNVVVCAGSWSGQIGTPGSPPAVRPIRGQLLRLRWLEAPLARIVWGPACYVVPWNDGTLLVGATAEDVGFDERATAAGVHDLLDAVGGLLSGAWRATFLEARVGLRPASDDGLPIIGASETVPGLFYATGHYRNGILLAPLTAQLIGDLVMEGKADPVLALVRPHR